ncbi:MAG TPA: dihydroneopterin aldolase [Pseudomonadales bacterium]|nr:dihydroneopterin aldolase [Pseudomonadales bacterium]
MSQKQNDIVYIRDLRIETIIGIFQWEREVKQIVSLDLDMAADIRAAAASDDIVDALDYKAISKRLIQFIEQSQFQLIEALAEAVADIVRNEFRVTWLRLRISKPGALRGAQDVGLLIERGDRQ